MSSENEDNLTKTKSKLSQEFEAELDEYFKERSEFRAVNFADSPRLPQFDQVQEEKKAELDPNNHPVQMSGCCMTGCFDCPWGYSIN